MQLLKTMLKKLSQPILFVCLLFSSVAHAHLLNMTKAEFTTTAAAEIEFTIEVDISRYFRSRLAYFEASVGEQCSLLNEHRHILENLLNSIEVTGFTDTDPDAAFVIEKSWAGLDCQFDQQQKSAYLDPLQWPKVTINGKLIKIKNYGAINALQVTFLTGFIFEEPIALTLRNGLTQKKMTRWLIALQKSPVFAVTASATSTVEEALNVGFYFVQGVYHILPIGVDHLLFVLALALAARSLRILFWSLTVFTLAHTCSLVASYFNVVNIPAAIIEPLIALTIAWAGVEVFRNPATYTLRLVVIFCFGLIHGLGFAGALMELGLPASNAMLLLLVFNLGVEVGQIIFVAGLLLLSLALARAGLPRTAYRSPLAVVIIVIGVSWTLLRLL